MQLQGGPWATASDGSLGLPFPGVSCAYCFGGFLWAMASEGSLIGFFGGYSFGAFFGLQLRRVPWVMEVSFVHGLGGFLGLQLRMVPRPETQLSCFVGNKNILETTLQNDGEIEFRASKSTATQNLTTCAENDQIG